MKKLLGLRFVPFHFKLLELGLGIHHFILQVLQIWK